MLIHYTNTWAPGARSKEPGAKSQQRGAKSPHSTVTIHKKAMVAYSRDTKTQSPQDPKARRDARSGENNN